MSLLDDPALWPVARTIPSPRVRVEHVRFRPSSTFARDFNVPVGAVGEVRSRYKQDGREMLDIWIEGVGYCTGVVAAETAQHDESGATP